MEVRITTRLLWLAVALVAFGVIMRILPHPANLAPIGAIALFGGAVLPKRLGWWLPLVIMMITDAILGFYDGILFTWIAFLCVGLYGMSLRGRSNWVRVPAGALGSGIIFFTVSNFGVWVSSGMYAHTLAGLIECYEMALPFFRNTFLGDFIYGWALFGAYAIAELMTTIPQRSNAAAREAEA